MALITGLLLVLLAWETARFPRVTQLRDQPPGETALMRLRRQQAADAGRPWQPRWEWVERERISLHLQRAVVAAEDARFFEHRGFDARGIDRALRDNLEQQRVVRGGSTITQQLAKNLWLSPHRSLRRKLREAAYTVALERSLDKRRLLELYLNVVEWGEGVFGAEAAAQTWFGIPAAQLQPQQAAALAVVLPDPRHRDPRRLTPSLERKRQRVLRGMRALAQRGTPGD